MTDKSTSHSIARRALLAILLMVGFYALAFAVAIALFYVPYAELRYLDRVDGRLALFCIIGGALILWSILPRPDRFEPPGPALDEAVNPELFSLLTATANATGQEMPHEVYLVPEVNAWVTLRGGIMGFGSRRVMGIGLPLLQILTVSQFRAVLAHEFGHYYGGDTSLGPWIYKTRAAIGRTIVRVANHSSVLSKPFVWYGLLFLRLTLRVSRQQEFSADALAARLVGSRQLSEGLKLIHGAAFAFDAYLMSEVVPALKAGYRPPVADGFGRFLKAKDISTGIAALIDAVAAAESDPYNSHPPLNERIAAIAHFPEDADADGTLALTLLRNLDESEGKLMAYIVSDYAGKGFKPVSWDEIVQIVWVPGWRARAHERRQWLKGLTPTAILELATDNSALAVRLRYAAHTGVTKDQHRAQAALVFGSALSLALHSTGWQLQTAPGEPVVFESHGVSITPFIDPGELISGTFNYGEWADICARGGISNLDLGAALETTPLD